MPHQARTVKFSDLTEVNYRVNLHPYKADPPDFDDWRPAPDGQPVDCDSYAVKKLRSLHATGWPIESLRLATCYVETGEYHAVLIATHEGADFVLDNRHSLPYSVSALPRIRYRPHIIQAFGGSADWVEWTGFTETPT